MKSGRESPTYRAPLLSISHATICRRQNSDMHSYTQTLRCIPLPFFIAEPARRTVHHLTLSASGFHLPYGGYLPYGRCESVRCPEAGRGWCKGWDAAKASPHAVGPRGSNPRYRTEKVRRRPYHFLHEPLWLLPTESDNCWWDSHPTGKTRLSAAHCHIEANFPLPKSQGPALKRCGAGLTEGAQMTS